MSSTLQAPPSAATTAPGLPTPQVPWTLRDFTRRRPWLVVSIILAVVAVAMVLYARTRPSFDAYGWLVWGYQTLHLSLDLGGAPSWKPMPYLFTVPFALFGHYQMWLWMFTCSLASLAGAVIGGRIAFRLIDPGKDPFGRRAAYVGATFAGLAVLGLEDYFHYILSAQTDPMIVTFTLAGLDCYLGGRLKLALLFGTLASLGRPEAWVFLGLLYILVWRNHRELLPYVIGSAVAIVFFWFGIPTITNHRPFIAEQLAQKSPRELHSNKIIGTLGRFTELLYLPMWIATLLTLAWAAVRRNLLMLVLAAGCALWVIVEIAFALHGLPALPRYLMEPAAICAAFVGVGVGWVLIEGRSRFGGAGGSGNRLLAWAGVPVVAVLVISMAPGALDRLRTEHRDLRHERARTHQITLLKTTTNVLGGARHISNCGQPVTDVSYVSALAWLYHRNVGTVGGLQQGVEKAELRDPHLPKVLIRPVSRGGWSVLPLHTRPNQARRCAALHATYAITSHHPGGVLVRR